MAIWVKCSSVVGDRFINFDLVALVGKDDPSKGSLLVLASGMQVTVHEPPEQLIKLAESARR